MTDADWLKAVLAAVGVVMVAPWVMWVSRAAAGALSRNEHRELCEEREVRIAADLEEIKTMMRDNNREAIDSQHNLANRVQELALDFARFTRDGPADEPQNRWRT